ncbi:m-AAA protease-interacting protein 1, mitochondrial [Polymixia lowei]
MQRITSIATRRELGVFTTQGPAAYRQCASVRLCAIIRPLAGETTPPGLRLRRPRGQCVFFAGQKHRPYSTEGRDEPQRAGGHPGVSVVGVPDPITWIRCKVVMHLIDLCFELGITSVEFDKGVKQALVHVSNMMSSGKFEDLRGIVSNKMVDYVEEKCKSLTDVQRQELAISVDDIIFLLPEDVSVFVDEYGRRFCFLAMRFWLLSTLEGPDDPEGTEIFKVASSEDGGPQKRVVTAVYEFQRELTRGAPSDWTITNVWHWHWKLSD